MIYAPRSLGETYFIVLIVGQHLHRVQEHSPANRMNAGNLAICFG